MRMRQALHVVVLFVVVLASLATSPGMRPASAVEREAPIAGSEDEVAQGYHRLLLEHTHWVESVWDASQGHYRLTDDDFVAVLGNAVVLKLGDYDEHLAGVPRDVLQDHTLRTIRHFAATDRWVDPGGEWGGSIYFASTYESYFTAAAHLLWDDLDERTRTDVDTITRGIANYITGLGAGEDPRSGGWRTNGLDGGFRSDTKLEEMGARTMPLAAALAYLPDDPSAPSWREWLDRWSSNMAGLPAADQANPALIDGTPVSRWNTAHNIFDTFAVENHGTFSAHYHEASSAYPGRNVAQFMISGAPVPPVLMGPPNVAELTRTLRRLSTDSGVAAYPMVSDRYHLYGRDVLPLAYQSVVTRDPDAARAERMLLTHLEPYLHFSPEFRLTKFSGQPSYEPEARAELAMAYLLHYERARFGGGAQPVSEHDYFQHAGTVVDYGSDLGMLAQQSPDALAVAVSKPGFVKFAYWPGHDDWLFDPSGGNPSFMPSVATTVTKRSAHVYRRVRDGVDASATLLRTSAGFAGYTTLPTGTVVYATSGLGAGEGALRVFNMNMPGVPGLDGDRTYYGADGQATLTPDEEGTVNGDSTIQDVAFPATRARYVRVLGVRPATMYGYSIWDLEAHDGDGPDLARGRPASASSIFGPGYEASRATDGDTTTRWAVSRGDRARPDSWLQVDLGSEQQVSRVRLNWETAAIAAAYRIQVSDDAVTWRDVASAPRGREFSGNWLNVDGRAGFVVHGSTNPIRVDAKNVTLSEGPASGSTGMVVEARPNQEPDATAAAAREPVPSGGPATLRASEADGYLSMFDLGDDPISHARLTLPQPGNEVRLYRGEQRTVDGGTSYDVSLAGSDARVEAPRFLLAPRLPGGSLPALSATVTDSRTVTITNLEHSGTAVLTLRAVDGSDSAEITVPAGQEKTVKLGHAPLTPVADLALTQITYPTSPLPAGMTDPDLAVDGDSATAWRPGGDDGRMVVDLGAQHSLARATLHWTPGLVAPFTVSASDDGMTYRTIAGSPGSSGPDVALDLGGASGRYIAIQVNGWSDQDAGLASLSLFAGTGGAP